jgi:hypothetical protein
MRQKIERSGEIIGTNVKGKGENIEIHSVVHVTKSLNLLAEKLILSPFLW